MPQKLRLFWFFFLYGPFCLAAQESFKIHGIVTDAKGDPVPQVTVRVLDSLRGITIAFAITRADGTFQINLNSKGRTAVEVSAEHVQFSRQVKSLTLMQGLKSVDPVLFVMLPAAKSMQEVVIRGDPPKFSVRGDTVEFRANAYRNGETRKVEDLLRNIQGFEVGPDGRISFNGKEVDRILVEGEDLTEQQYQLLSRNLNAGLVDKVQVIQRYDPNRLSAGIAGSDKVGINLRIDPNSWKKWTGSLELGVGNDARRLADLNLVRLAKSFKLIHFLQHNTTGQVANVNMNHYFGAEGKSPARSEGPVPAQGLIQAGLISPPSLGATYTRDNKDYSGFIIGSWKMGPSISMKVLAGAADNRLSFQSSGTQEVFLPDGNGWVLLSTDSASSHERQGVLRFSLSHDAGKNNLGTLTVDFLGSRSTHNYANRTTGAITDKLLESLQTDNRLFRISTEESVLLKPGKLLRAAVSWRRDRPQQIFHADTERFLGYFGLDSGQAIFRQQLPGLSDAAEADIMLMFKRKKIRWSAGLRAAGELLQYQSNTYRESGLPQTDSLLRDGYSTLRTGRFTGYARIRMPQGRNGEWLFGGACGYGSMEFLDSAGLVSAGRVVYRAYAGFSHALSPLKQFSIQLQSHRDMPDNVFFHPDGLLSGQATVLDGTRELQFPLSHSATATYALNNLQKASSWVFMASGGMADRQYNIAQWVNPAYSILYPWLSDGNRNASFQIKGEQYVKRIRSKISIQASVLQSEQDLVFNAEPIVNRMGNLRLQAGWISAFKGIFNAEFSMAGWYTRNETFPENGEDGVFSQWQYHGYVRLRARFSDKLSATCLYNGYVLFADSYFQSLDCYAKWNVHRSVSLSVYGHNLLQTKAIESQYFSPNQQTARAFELVGPYLIVKVLWQF